MIIRCNFCRGEALHRFPCPEEGRLIGEPDILTLGVMVSGRDGRDRQGALTPRSPLPQAGPPARMAAGESPLLAAILDSRGGRVDA